MLQVDALEVRYGTLAAVRNVSLRVECGETVCIVGPNGAGKSSTLLALAGVRKPSKGAIMLDGESIGGAGAEAIVRLGVALVPEGRHIFGTLTVGENLKLATHMRRDRGAIHADMDRVLELFPILRERVGSSAGKLSGGEQQMLAIARAILVRPRIMLIDEPSLGLAPQVIDLIYDVLLDLRDEGMTFLVVEQSAERALGFADRLYVMRSGELVLEGAAEMLDDEAIECAYFGF